VQVVFFGGIGAYFVSRTHSLISVKTLQQMSNNWPQLDKQDPVAGNSRVALA